jgi:hypothetical protein
LRYFCGKSQPDFASFRVFSGQVQPLFLETKKPGIQARPLRHMKNVEQDTLSPVPCQSPELVTAPQQLPDVRKHPDRCYLNQFISNNNHLPGFRWG